MNEIRLFAQELAELGGAIARERFGAIDLRTVEVKAARDYVSYVDKLVEVELTKRITARFPHHRILGEEGGASGATTGPTWIIDPVDGTTNFVRGIPLFAVSVGFCDEHGAAAGAIREPMRGETFTAHRDGDFTINGVVTRSSGCTRMDRAIIASALPFRTPAALADAEPVFCAVQRACDDHRRTGAASIDLAWVAAGRMDAYYEIGIYPWDIAAGMVMVRCAGGMVTDYRGVESGLLRQRSIVAAATPALHAALLPFVAPLIPWVDHPAFGSQGASA